jgi:hypothetical protein
LYRFNKIPTLPYLSTSDEGAPGRAITGIRAWPNPFGDRICLEFDNGVQNYVFLDIYDLNGRLLSAFRKSVIPNTRNRIYWNGNSDRGIVDPGMYLIIIRGQRGERAGRVLVIRE